jgi:hypothetical protein
MVVCPALSLHLNSPVGQIMRQSLFGFYLDNVHWGDEMKIGPTEAIGKLNIKTNDNAGQTTMPGTTVMSFTVDSFRHSSIYQRFAWLELLVSHGSTRLSRVPKLKELSKELIRRCE